MNTCTVCVLMPCHIPLKTTNYSSKLNSTFQASRHIIINTYNVERHMKILNGEGSLCQMYKCVSVSVLQHIIVLRFVLLLYYSVALCEVIRTLYILVVFSCYLQQGKQLDFSQGKFSMGHQ